MESHYNFSKKSHQNAQPGQSIELASAEHVAAPDPNHRVEGLRLLVRMFTPYSSNTPNLAFGPEDSSGVYWHKLVSLHHFYIQFLKFFYNPTECFLTKLTCLKQTTLFLWRSHARTWDSLLHPIQSKATLNRFREVKKSGATTTVRVCKAISDTSPVGKKKAPRSCPALPQWCTTIWLEGG